MKRSYIPLFVAGLLGVVIACTDMLEQTDPTGPTGEEFFATENDLQQAVIAAYSGLSLPGSFHRISMVGFEQFSDNVYHGSSTTDGAHATWTTFNYDPNREHIERTYESF